MSHPNYDRMHKFSVTAVIGQMRDFTHNTDHQFWADEISLLDDSLFDSGRIHGPKQLTDLYLLALATRQNGRLVTFDQGIPLSTVKIAKAKNLYVA